MTFCDNDVSVPASHRQPQQLFSAPAFVSPLIITALPAEHEPLTFMHSFLRDPKSFSVMDTIAFSLSSRSSSFSESEKEEDVDECSAADEVVPMRIVCRSRVFVVNAQRLASESPLFALVLLSESTSWRHKKRKRHHQHQYEMLSREIVDEKWEDIDTFLRCLHRHNAENDTDSKADDECHASISSVSSFFENKEQCSVTSQINERNFATVLRLAHKYQVKRLVVACERFLNSANLNEVKADQALTLLMTANEFEVGRPAVAPLVLRLARESDEVLFLQLRVNRFLPQNLCRSIVATRKNMRRLLVCVPKATRHYELFRTTINAALFHREQSPLVLDYNSDKEEEEKEENSDVDINRT